MKEDASEARNTPRPAGAIVSATRPIGMRDTSLSRRTPLEHIVDERIEPDSVDPNQFDSLIQQPMDALFGHPGVILKAIQNYTAITHQRQVRLHR